MMSTEATHVFERTQGRGFTPADAAGGRVPLEPAVCGSSAAAVRAALAQRRERVRRSSAGESAPCERCGREWCVRGSYLGPACRAKAGAR
jgi:hypothetical protein